MKTMVKEGMEKNPTPKGRGGNNVGGQMVGNVGTYGDMMGL
jgi:hypothetical protein